MTSLIDTYTTNTLIKPDTVVTHYRKSFTEGLILICLVFIQKIKEQVPERISLSMIKTPIPLSVLLERSFHRHRDNIKYAAKGKDCKKCELHLQCTRDSYARSVQRHIRKETQDKIISITKSPKSKRDITIRQCLMDLSCARSIRYGFDKARWRGLWKVNIQGYIICAIQNIETLIRYMGKPIKGTLTKPLLKGKINKKIKTGCQHIFYSIRSCLNGFINMCILRIFKSKADCEYICAL